ncbi:hypothetical protein BHE74_00024607 [Ensete ventricosum]|nr:hypothetical protein BHE74_00024607 [Ensete ventricosum]RZR84789.1 hypothetical protein BHM03_00011670 [Ensete ventricosum]
MKCLLFFFLITVLSTSLHAPVATGAASIGKTIVVNPSGTGDFRSIQEAIDSVPDFNNQWVKIHLASGVYRFDRHCSSCAKHADVALGVLVLQLMGWDGMGWGGVCREKVVIGASKTYILLEGEGAQKTSIEWGDYAKDSAGHDTASCATFTSYASNIVVAGITFKVSFAVPLRSLCTNEITYAESECTGPGSNQSGRVKWKKALTNDELRTFTDISYIDNEGWLSKQPQY